MTIESVRQRFLKFAAVAAEASDYNRGQKLGCVVFHKKKVLSIGWNQEKTHTLQKTFNTYREDVDDSKPHKLHAEIHAISHLIGTETDFADVSILVCRLSKQKDKKYALAKPCPACMACLKKLGIKHIYYTTDDGFAYELID